MVAIALFGSLLHPSGHVKLTITVPCTWAIRMKVQGLFRYEGRSSKRGAPRCQLGKVELTLRAEEVGSQKACINVGHIASPVVDADWHAFC